MRVVQASFLAAALAATALSPLWAQTAPAAPAQITVTGEGVIDAAPDMATLSLGVTTQAESAAEAMKANTAALAGVVARLKAAGVADRDLQTSNLSLNPNWTGYDSASSGSTPKIAGYTASNQLDVRIRALDSLGTVLDAAISDGANTLNGLTFGLSEPRPLQDKARSAAVKDAQARAQLLVEAAGVKLGPIISISESAGYSHPTPSFRQMAVAAEAVPVAAGEVSLSSQVTVVYQILQ